MNPLSPQERYAEKMALAGAPLDVPTMPEGENPDAQRRLYQKLAIGGRPEWSNENIPAEKRIGDYLAVQARAGTGWEEVQSGLKGLGIADPNSMKSHFDLEGKRAHYSGKQEDTIDTMGYLGRRSIPFVSEIYNWDETRAYGKAQERFKTGQASADDMDLIAKVERIQDIDRKRGTDDAVISELARIPSLLGEGFVAGKAVGTIGRALPVRATPPLYSTRGVLQTVAPEAIPTLGRVAGTTTLMPSMYLEHGAQNQLEHPNDSPLQNYGSAWTLGAIQTAVLGRIGQKGGNLLGRTGEGMAEMQVADTAASGLDDIVKEVSGKTLGINTRYGLLGSVLRNDDDAGKHAIVQTVTFGAFAKLHGRDPQRVMDAHKLVLDTSRGQGLSETKANRDLVDAVKPVQDLLRENPTPDAEALQKIVENAPKRTKPYVEAVVETVKPRTAEEAAQRIRDARPDLAESVKPTGRPEEVSSPAERPTPKTPRERLELATQDRNKADVRLAEAERKVRAAGERVDILYPMSKEGQDARRRAQAEYAEATTELRKARRERKEIQRTLDTARDELMKQPSEPTGRQPRESAPPGPDLPSGRPEAPAERVPTSARPGRFPLGPREESQRPPWMRQPAQQPSIRTGPEGLGSKRPLRRLTVEELRRRQAERPPVPVKVVDTTNARNPFERIIPGERSVNPETEAATRRAEDEFQRIEASAQDAVSPAGQKAERKAERGAVDQMQRQAEIRAEKQEQGEPRAGWKAIKLEPAERGSVESLLTEADRVWLKEREGKLPRPELDELKGLKPRERIKRELELITESLRAEDPITHEDVSDVQGEYKRTGLSDKAARSRVEEVVREGETDGRIASQEGAVRSGAGEAGPAGGLTKRGLRADDRGPESSPAESGSRQGLSDHDKAVFGLIADSPMAKPNEAAAMKRVVAGGIDPADVAVAHGLLERVVPLMHVAKAMKAAEDALGKMGTTVTYEPLRKSLTKPSTPQPLIGNETKITVSGGSIPARFEVRELDTVRASHQALSGGALRGRPVEEYPAGLQPRDYSKIPGEQEKVARFAREMVPAYWISHHPDPTSGPPTITTDGTVVNGNGRQMALERAVQMMSFPKYKADLLKHAAGFGIDPKAVEGMKHPVLYRVVEMDAKSPEAQRFARAGNVGTTQSQSPVRTAASLSGLIDPHVIDSLKLDGDTTFSEAITDPTKGKAFRDRLAKELPPQEVSRYLTEEGRLTDAGTELVRNMLLSKVLPVDLVERMGENMKAVKRTVEGAIPQLIKLKRDFPKNDPTPALVEALQVWSRNDHIRTVADADNLLAQGDLFSGGKAVNISPNGRMMLDFVLENGMRPLVFRKKLVGLVTDIEHTTKGLFAEPTADLAEAAANVLGVKKREGAKFGEGGLPPGVFFHKNRPPSPPTQGTSTPSSAAGPFEINKTIDALLGAPNYLSSRVPYDRSASAAALTGPQAIVTGKLAAGDPYIRLEEAMHILSHKVGFEFDPKKLPPDVAQGFREFYDPTAKLDREAMVEGLASWAVDRASGIAPAGKQQKAAAAYAESWATQHGLTEKLDRIRAMFGKMREQPAVEQAAGNISATGRPVEAEITRVEAARDKAGQLARDFEDTVDNDLGALRRLERASVLRGNKKSEPGTSPEEVFAQTRFRDADLADEFERKGYFHFDEQGHRVYSNKGIDHVLEPWAKEDMKPVAPASSPGWLRSVLGLYENPKAVSKAGVFMTARHVIDEAQRGRQYVSDEQLALFKKAMAEFERDPEFVRRATEAHDRATAHVFNDGLRMLAHESVHRFNPELVEQLIRERPTYVPLTRVKEEGDWQAHSGKSRGEQMANPIKKRMGSGEQILDPLVSIKDRYRSNAYQLNEQMRRSAVAKLLMQPGMGEFALAGEARLTERGQGEYARMQADGLTAEQAAEAMRTVGGAEYYTHAPWPKDGRVPTWYWAGPGGKMVEFRVKDRALYDLITGQQVAASQSARLMNAISQFTVFGVKPLEVVNKAVRTGATTLSVGFQIRNLFPTRDPLSFWRNTIDRMSVKELPQALGDVYRFEFAQLMKRFTGKESKDALLKLFIENRGGQQKQFAFDPTRKESAFDAVKASDRPRPIRVARSVLGFLKDAFNVAGAGELGPRYLEFQNRLVQTTGKTKAELRAILESANKVKLTTEAREPIPYPLILDALQHAAEVTVPFGRQGILTRELNRITPFFGPAVSGMSKAIRNWKTNPKGAAFGVAGILGLRLLHYALFSDEDWWGELSPHDKYDNFVLPFNGKLYRVPGPRDLDVPVGGTLTLALDAARKKNPDLRGLINETLMSNLPPGINRPAASLARGEVGGAMQEAAVAPLGPLATTALDITRNQDHTGRKLVPRRHESIPAIDKALDYQVPYALNQLTGGRGEPTLRGSGLVPFSPVGNARRSIDQFYDELHAAEQAKAAARYRLRALPKEAEERLKALHATEAKLADLNRELRGEKEVRGKVVKVPMPSEERVAAIRREQIELARKALAGR